MSPPTRSAALTVCYTVTLLASAGLVRGQQPPTGAVRAKAPEEIYAAVAPSSVAFLSGRHATGAGVVVDAKRKLLLTAYHVVHDDLVLNRDIHVLFPEKKDGTVVTDVSHYFGVNDNFRKKVKAEFVAGDLHTDLAVLRVPQLPAGVAAVPLAAKPPRPAERVHVVGCSTSAHGGLFGYNQGFVRNTYLWAYGKHLFHTIAHHSPTNHGDSGGPVVNDRGELVGVVSQGTNGNNVSWWVNQQLIDHAVSITDIQEVLAHARTGKRPYQAPGGTSLVVTATASLSIDAKAALRHAGDDFFYLPAVKGEKVSVSLKGSGASDLDLYADAGRGQPFFAKTGNTDQEADAHAPGYAGPFRIWVSNALTEKERTALAERRKKGDKISAAELYFTKQNRYTLTVTTARPLAGPLYVNRSIPASTADEIRVTYDAKKGPVRLRLVGVGQTDLDLHVFAPSDQKREKAAHAGTGYLDRETLIFAPAESGVYTIRVKNLGKQWNRYCLSTN